MNGLNYGCRELKDQINKRRRLYAKSRRANAYIEITKLCTTNTYYIEPPFICGVRYIIIYRKVSRKCKLQRKPQGVLRRVKRYIYALRCFTLYRYHPRLCCTLYMRDTFIHTNIYIYITRLVNLCRTITL